MPTTKNDMPAKRRYGSTTQLLSYLSAAGCGISLLALGALVTVAVGKQIGKTLLQPGNEIMGLVGYFIGICVVGCLVVASGVACGRFLLRALPPAMSHQDRRNRSSGVVAFYIAFISLYVLGICVFLVSREAQPDRDSLGLFENLVGNLLAAMLWAGSAIGLLIRRHHKPRGFLERPFVLFLRRFSTFPDRAVIAVILKQASYDVPVVFLTPTLSRPRDWDPYLVGLAGLKLLHPWRSAPIVIRARDDAWQEAADELIRRAHAILLDTSETSSALHTEAEMLDRAGRLSETVCLSLLVPNASAGDDPISGFSGVHTIQYTKSWLRALPRMLMGVPIVLLAAISLGASIPALGLLSPDSATQGVVASVVVVLAVVYYCSAFVLPTINREAKVALRRVLRAGQTARTNREAPQGIGGWLILSVIGLIMAPYSLLTQFWLTWENLTTPGIVMHHYLSGRLITFGIIELLVIIALSITTLVLLFRKSKKTPAFAIALLGINAVFIVLDHFLVGPFSTIAQQADPDDARGVLIVAIVVAAICIPYFLVSQRVKATFVR